MTILYQKNKIGIGLLKDTEFKLDNTYKLPKYRNETWDKNVLLRDMINDQCEHLFLINSNISSVNDGVFETYIESAKASGIWVLFFKENNSSINSIQYENVEISFQPKLTKSFTYLHRGVIKNVGFFDERYDSSVLEHDDLVYRIIQRGLLPGWGWFPDTSTSQNYIKYNASIIPIKDQIWFNEKTWFKHKHQIDIDDIKTIKEATILTNLEKIKTQFQKRNST